MASDSLLTWCQTKTSKYYGVQIKDFTSSWRDGLAFNALIHSQNPNLFDFDSLNKSEHKKNLNHAFDLAEKHFRITKLLDADDIDVEDPDEKSVLIYVSSYFHSFTRITNNEQKLNKSELIEQGDQIEIKSANEQTTAQLVNVIHGYDNRGFAHEEPDTYGNAKDLKVSSVPKLAVSRDTESFSSIDSIGKINDKNRLTVQHINDSSKTKHEWVDESISERSNTNLDLLSPPRTPENQGKIRWICLTRASENESYGFEFKTIKKHSKHFICGVEENSIASRAELKIGDCLYDVNGETINDLHHNDVSAKILSNLTRVDLSVINELDLFRKCLKEIDGNNVKATKTSKIIKLLIRPDFEGFGFSVRNTMKGPYIITDIEEDSPADRERLQDGDVILKINSLDLENVPFKKVIPIIKRAVDEKVLTLEIISDSINLEPRLCEFNVGEDEKLGFNLIGARRPYKGVFKIISIKENSPAALSGLAENDFLVEVSGQKIDELTYDEVMLLILKKKSIGELSLLVADEQTWFRIKNIKMTRVRSNGTPVFKKCHIQLISSSEKTFGFKIFTDSEIKPKLLIENVEPNSPAFKANVRAKDVLIEINKQNVRRMKPIDVMRLINDCLHKRAVEILVIDEKGFELFKKNNKTFSSEKIAQYATKSFYNNPSDLDSNNNKEIKLMEVDSGHQPLPRRCQLDTNKQELGFNFLASKTENGLFIINNIVPGSTAAESGILDNDFLIEVSGVSVKDKTNKEVIDFIIRKKDQGDLWFLVVDRITYEWYLSRNMEITSLLLPQKKTEDIIDLNEITMKENNPDEITLDNVETSDDSNKNIVVSNSSKVHFDGEAKQSEPEFSNTSRYRQQSVNYEVHKFTIIRESDRPLGLALEMTQGSVSSKKNKKLKKVSVAQTVSKIDTNSPAEKAGLKEGDLIIEVNGNSTQGESNKKVSGWIRSSGLKIDLRVRRQVKISTAEEELAIQQIDQVLDNEQASAVIIESLNK